MTPILHVGVFPRDQNALGQAHAEHPDWPAPNYVNPQTRVPLLVGISCAMGGLCLILMAARLYTRGVLSKKGLGLDDYMMAIATTLAVALVAIVCVCARYGTGYHQWDLRPEWSPHWGKATFCQNLAMVLAATFTKVSILLTYLYIFPQRSNQIFCWTGIAFISLFGAANVITTCLQCTPIASYWDSSVEKKGCIDINSYLYTSGAINSLTDIIVYLWPSHKLFALELPLGKRIGLCVTFSAGLIAVVASVARLVSVHNASFSDDSTYSGFWIALWKVLEVCFGVMCGCLPAVKPILKPLLPKSWLGSRRSQAARTGTYGNNSFNRLEHHQGPSHSYDGMDLAHLKHSKSDRIQVSTITSIVGHARRSTESEEKILQTDFGKQVDRR